MPSPMHLLSLRLMLPQVRVRGTRTCRWLSRCGLCNMLYN